MIKKIVPNDIESMLNLIFDYGIATPEQIEGITHNELKQLEDEYGRFPQDYRDILLAIGKNAGYLISNRDEFQLYYDDLIELNKDVHESRAEALSEGEVVADLPNDIFFINARFFTNPFFIKTNNGNDCKVYKYLNEWDRVEFLCDSFWEVYADFILERKFFIDLAKAKTQDEKDKVNNEYSESGLFG